MLHDYLKQLGFNEKEITIYLAIVEHGKLSASALAKLTKINRATVYSVSKELIKKGVIQEDLGGLSRYFSVTSTRELRAMYAAEEREIEKKRSLVEEAIRELDALPKSKKYSVPKIRFVDEIRLKDFLYNELPVWIENAKTDGDKTFWGFQDVSLLEEYPDWVNHFWEVLPADFSQRLLTNDKDAERSFSKEIKTKQREVKYWDQSLNFTATYAILGDYVLFAMTKEHPHYFVEIHDAVMAENLRGIFKGIWEKI